MMFDDQNFENEVLKFNGPVLVDFFATWCGPCQVLGPIIEELAEEMKASNVKIGKADVDKSPNTAQKYDIMSVPTLILFKNGEVKEMMNGLQNKEVLREKIEQLIKS